MKANIFTIVLATITLLTGLLWLAAKFILISKKITTKVIDKNNKNKYSDKKLICLTKLKTKWIEDGSSFFPILAIIFILRSFVYEPFQIPSGSMMPTLMTGDFILVEKFSYGIKDPFFQRTLIKTGKPKRGDIVVFKYPKSPSLDYVKRIIGLPGDKIIYDKVSKKITILTKYINNGNISRNFLPIKYSNIEPSNFVQTFTYCKDGKISSNFLNYSKEINEYNSIRMIERKETIGNLTHRILITPILQDRQEEYYQQLNQQLSTWIVPLGQYFMMGDNRDNSSDSRYWGFVPETNILGKTVTIWMSFEKKEGQLPTGIRFKRIGRIKDF